jgi:hemolysin activation/secretion protein
MELSGHSKCDFQLFAILMDWNNQLVPFFDIGTVWNHRGEILSPSTLASIGLGLRWQLDSYFSVRLDWGNSSYLY